MPINGIETAYKDRYTFAPPSQRAAQWYTLPLRFIVLKSIFAKTDTHRQSELVAQLLQVE